jgi:hypothetical protein
MTAPLTVKLPVRDKDGRVISEKEVATYAGLLARAHEEGLRRITTMVVQAPSPDNAHTTIVRAEVETDKGVFSGIGDAGPDNVNRRIAPHAIRMAETRAKARALRDAVNIGIVALEELSGDEDFENGDEPRPRNGQSGGNGHGPSSGTNGHANGNGARQAATNGARSNSNGRQRYVGNTNAAMTPAQRGLLLRLAAERGLRGDEAESQLCSLARAETMDDITKGAASRIIEGWTRDGGNGANA